MGKVKDWYIKSWKESLNNPMKDLIWSLVFASIFISASAICAGYFFITGDYLMVVMSLGWWLIPVIIFNDAVYKPMKLYYEKYGKTGRGDEFEREALETGKPMRVVLKY